MDTSPTRELQHERDPRGRKPTCECGSCAKCIYRVKKRLYMRKYNAGLIDKRPRIWTAERDAMLPTLTNAEAAEAIGVTPSAVARRRHKLGIPTPRRTTAEGHINKSGYRIVVLPPGDPLVDMTRSGRQAMEHRVVMARYLGRPLTQDEFVHHRNGQRADNRIENLELWSRSHPDGQRVEDKFQWAVEFIERYCDEMEVFLWQVA